MVIKLLSLLEKMFFLSIRKYNVEFTFSCFHDIFFSKQNSPLLLFATFTVQDCWKHCWLFWYKKTFTCLKGIKLYNLMSIRIQINFSEIYKIFKQGTLNPFGMWLPFALKYNKQYLDPIIHREVYTEQLLFQNIVSGNLSLLNFLRNFLNFLNTNC